MGQISTTRARRDDRRLIAYQRSATTLCIISTLAWFGALMCRQVLREGVANDVLGLLFERNTTTESSPDVRRSLLPSRCAEPQPDFSDQGDVDAGNDGES